MTDLYFEEGPVEDRRLDPNKPYSKKEFINHLHGLAAMGQDNQRLQDWIAETLTWAEALPDDNTIIRFREENGILHPMRDISKTQLGRAK